MAVLQLTVVFITFFSCIWQCYTNRALRSQIRMLQKTHQHSSLPPPDQSGMEVESLGQTIQWNDSRSVSVARGNSVGSAESALHVRRSSSTSKLSDLCRSAERIQTKLSQSEGVGGRDDPSPSVWSVGGMDVGSDHPLTSSSAANLGDFPVSLLHKLMKAPAPRLSAHSNTSNHPLQRGVLLGG
jgi:hypothetical protein